MSEKRQVCLGLRAAGRRALLQQRSQPLTAGRFDLAAQNGDQQAANQRGDSCRQVCRLLTALLSQKMPENTARALSNKRKRGAVKASLTRLVSRVDSIERAPDLDEARRLTTWLESVVAEFKVHHYSVIDLLDDEDEDGIQEQQTVLDEHEDIVAQLTARLEKVMASSTAKDSNEPKVASKRLRAIERGLSSIITGTSSLPPGDEDNICLLQQCDQQLSELKAEFLVIRNIFFSLDIDDHHELHDQVAHVEGRIFDCSVKIKKLLRSHSPPSTSSSDPIGIKLPKRHLMVVF